MTLFYYNDDRIILKSYHFMKGRLFMQYSYDEIIKYIKEIKAAVSAGRYRMNTRCFLNAAPFKKMRCPEQLQ